MMGSSPMSCVTFLTAGFPLCVCLFLFVGTADPMRIYPVGKTVKCINLFNEPPILNSGGKRAMWFIVRASIGPGKISASALRRVVDAIRFDPQRLI